MLRTDSFAACSGTLEVAIGGSISASVTVSGFPACPADGQSIGLPGSFTAGCDGGDIGGASASVDMTVTPLSFHLTGAAAAAHGSGAQSAAIASVNLASMQLRAVGSRLRVTMIGLSVSVSALGTITTPINQEFELGAGQTRTFSYQFGVTASGSFAGGGTGPCVLDITATEVPPTSFNWTNVAGGEYAVAANWNPNCDFPGSGQDALFTMPFSYTITGSGAAARRWLIAAGHPTFSGSGEVFSTGVLTPSLRLQAGARLTLHSAAFRSQHTLIDGALSDPSLFVVGGGWDNAGRIMLGRGTLAVQDAASASTGELSIGLGSTPSLVGVTREGVLNVTRTLTVGETHVGTMEITDGGSVHVTQPNSELAIIGKGAEGRVTLRDTIGNRSATLVVEKTLSVGESARGRLIIEEGGYVRAGTLVVSGANPAGNGELVVSGATDTALLDANSSIVVNATELSEVLIRERAVVFTPELLIGDNQARPGVAEVTVQGPNARLNVDDTFVGAAQPVQPTVVGLDAPGQLTIEGGAETRLNGGLIVGGVTPGTVFVTSLGAPAQSKLRVTGETTVGYLGRGTIEIGDDALMTVEGPLIVGMGPASPSGVVRVSPQSFLTVNGTMSIGDGGEGRVTAALDSFLTVAETLGVGITSPGILDLSDGARGRCETLLVGGNDPVAAGTITVGTLGNLTVIGNAQVGIGGGPGEIHLSEATAVLTVGGSMEVGNPVGSSGGGGTVRLSGARIDGAGMLKINKNGALTGTGRVNRRVDLGGVISPGLSPGLLTINGDFNQLSDGILIIEVAGLAPGQFDVLAVNGNVTLNGTLELRFLDGFLPKQGDVIQFLDLNGTLSNNFAQIVLPQAAPGFEAELNLTRDRKVRLIARNDATAGAGASIISPALTVTPPLRFTQFSLNLGQLSLAWHTIPGRSYWIEAKEDLDAQSWTAASTNILADGSSLSMTFDVSGARRFYRVAESE